jgi:hypothetical protein
LEEAPENNGFRLLWSIVLLVIIGKILLFAYLYRPLPESAYFSPFIGAQILTTPRAVSVLLATLLPLLFCWRTLRWSNFDFGNRLRWLFFGIAAVLAWKFSAYPYNYYYDQSHFFDRCLLVALAGLILVHPSLLPAFLLMASVLINQFYYPLLTQSWTEKLLLFELLIAFNACLFLKIALKRLNTDMILLILLSILGANYFSAGLRKLDISPHGYEWVLTNQMHYILAQVHEMGWLGFVGLEQFISLMKFLRAINIPLQLSSSNLEASPFSGLDDGPWPL